MSKNDFDLLTIARGTITAPAGCGKTSLIADALTRHVGPKPVLVLTHTNAGVAALRTRLGKAGVPPKAYRLATIDGWAMRLISNFSRCVAVMIQTYFNSGTPKYIIQLLSWLPHIC